MSDTTTTTEQPLWELQWNGQRWASTDLTGEHAAAVGELLGMPPPWDWFDLSDQHPALGPLQTMSLIAAFICIDEGVRGEAARRAVLDTLKGATLDRLADAIVTPKG